MKKKFIVIAALAGALVACGDAAKNGETEAKTPTTESTDAAKVESDDKEESEEKETKLAAINDKTKRSEGAVECVTKQYALVKAGKFDEAMEYYSTRIRAKVQAEIDANPAIKKDWQAATNLSKAEYEEIINSVRETPELFVFEKGMWRMDQR